VLRHLVFSVFIAANAGAQESLTAAAFWKGTTEIEKRMYVRGFSEGAEIAMSRITQFYRDTTARKIWFKPKPANGQPFDSVAKGYVRDLVTANDLADPIIAIMDSLYLAPSNACVTIREGLLAAVRRLKGDAGDAVEAYLRGARARAANRAECHPFSAAGATDRDHQNSISRLPNIQATRLVQWGRPASASRRDRYPKSTGRHCDSTRLERAEPLKVKPIRSA
jgi:hypothetical protein